MFRVFLFYCIIAFVCVDLNNNLGSTTSSRFVTAVQLHFTVVFSPPASNTLTSADVKVLRRREQGDDSFVATVG